MCVFNAITLHLQDSTAEEEKVTLRKSKRSKKARLPSINGHVYNPKTRVFTPEFDTVSTVRVDNMLKSKDVIQILLSKFRIENDPRGECSDCRFLSLDPCRFV